MRKVLFLLEAFVDADVDWLAEVGTRSGLEAGAVLIREGQPVTALFCVLEGELHVRVDALGGKQVASLGSGELVGELSFLDSRAPSATVVAGRDSVVLAIPRDALSGRLESDQGFAARFYRALGLLLAARLRKTVHQLGYGDDKLDADVEYEDELDPALLDGVAVAGKRFDWLLKRLSHD